MVNVGDMVVYVIWVKWQLYFSTLFTVRSAAAAQQHNKRWKLKFPLESAIFGRIQKFHIFSNSARKVRKDGIGPEDLAQKNFGS